MLVNVFGYDDDKKRVYPLRVPTDRHAGRALLVLIGDEDKGHYVVIKCMSRLLCEQTTMKRGKRFYCNNCLEGFLSDVFLQNHVTRCDRVSRCEELDNPFCEFRADVADPTRVQHICFRDSEDNSTYSNSCMACLSYGRSGCYLHG